MMCQSDGDIFRTMSKLIIANDLKHPNKRFDHIIIECSAYAEPRALTKQFQVFGEPIQPIPPLIVQICTACIFLIQFN